MKKLILALTFMTSTSYAGLCLDQLESCFKDYGHYCMGVKALDANEETQNGVKIINKLCLVGANVICYKEVTTTFGRDICEKEAEELEKAPSPAPKPKFEAKENNDTSLNK